MSMYKTYVVMKVGKCKGKISPMINDVRTAGCCNKINEVMQCV